MSHVKPGLERLAVLLGLLFVGLAPLGSASAQEMRQVPPHGQGMVPPHEQGMTGPVLTPEQQARAQQIYQEDGQKIVGLRQQLINKRRELNGVVMSQSPDERRIQGLVDEVANLHKQILQAEIAMQRRLSQAGIPTRGLGMCPMCPPWGGMGGWMGGQGEHCGGW